jgi:hypothetical protein
LGVGDDSYWAWDWDTSGDGWGGDDGCDDYARLSYRNIAYWARRYRRRCEGYGADCWRRNKSNSRWNCSNNARVLRNVCRTDTSEVAKCGLNLVR